MQQVDVGVFSTFLNVGTFIAASTQQVLLHLLYQWTVQQELHIIFSQKQNQQR